MNSFVLHWSKKSEIIVPAKLPKWNETMTGTLKNQPEKINNMLGADTTYGIREQDCIFMPFKRKPGEM